MNRWHKRICAMAFSAALGISSAAAWATERIVVLTPDVASIVAALGEGKKVVGRDRSSRFPELQHATDVGFNRSLNLEPIVRLQPSLVLGSGAAQPASLWQQFERVGIRAEQVSAREDGSDFAANVRKIGRLLNRAEAADKIAKDWESKMQPRPKTGVRYLFTYDGHLVAGRNTAADTLIRIAGGTNVATHDGFKPLVKEVWQSSQPDVVVVATHNHAVTGGASGLKNRPELADTPAGRNNRIYELPADKMFRIDLSSPETVQHIEKL